MRISETFKSIQGEGKFQGYPVLFIRVSGCTRKCDFCDTKYHTKARNISNSQLIDYIAESTAKIIVFTGGEPLLYLNDLAEITNISYPEPKYFHIETNGDLIKQRDDMYTLDNYFDYVCISPKDLKVAKRVHEFVFKPWYDYDTDFDIKVVTDLETLNIDMIKYATMLMPLTTYNKEKDNQIRQKVWDYCSKNNLFYSARLHVETWGESKGV
jgi:organic radical activating enzyme